MNNAIVPFPRRMDNVIVPLPGIGGNCRLLFLHYVGVCEGHDNCCFKVVDLHNVGRDVFVLVTGFIIVGLTRYDRRILQWGCL